MHYSGHAELPGWAAELTDAQRAVLEPPYVYNRPLVEDDGVGLASPEREGQEVVIRSAHDEMGPPVQLGHLRGMMHG